MAVDFENQFSYLTEAVCSESFVFLCLFNVMFKYLDLRQRKLLGKADEGGEPYNLSNS